MSTKNKANSASQSDPKSISDHLGELRRRLTWVVLTLILMSVLAYLVHDALVSFVLSPIGDQKLVYLTPGGGFTFIFQVVLYAGMLLSAPVAIYQSYRFVAPALPHSLRQKGLRVVIVSSLLMLAGASFGYFVAVPAALQFLTTFAGDFVQANLTADSYLGFVVAYVLGLGLLFQLPLFLIAWNWINPIKPGGLWNSQRFVIVGAFTAAALLTPTPDVFNQSLLAIPIIAVYQIGVISVYMMNRRRRSAVSDRRIAQVDRYAEPVLDVASLFGSETVPSSKPEPSLPSSRVSQPVAPVTSSHRPAPRRSLDGLRPVRRQVVAVPHRSASLGSSIRRAEVVRSSPGPVRARRSIDGFPVS